MRNLVYATFPIACVSTAARAQADDKRPASAAPMPAVACKAREAWRQDYVAWFIGEIPSARAPPPPTCAPRIASKSSSLPANLTRKNTSAKRWPKSRALVARG